MASIPDVKLYGELHRADGLLEAYHTIFVDAQREGIKLCFLERQPFWQESTDEMVRAISAYDQAELAFHMANILKEYNSHTQSVFRSEIPLEYLGYLSVLTGIKIIHADLGIHPVRMQIASDSYDQTNEKSFKAIRETFTKADISTLAAKTGNSYDHVKEVLREIKREMPSEPLWHDGFHADRKKRMGEDRLAAEFILSRLEGASAIAIFGKNHLDHEREDSLTGIMGKETSIRAYVFHIVGNKIYPRPGLIGACNQETFPPKGLNVPITPEDAESLHAAAEQGDPQAQTKLGKMYLNGAGVPPDSTEAHWWLSKAAQQGVAEAQYETAITYTNDDAVFRNYHKAFFWASKSAMQNYAKAQTLMGDFYHKGRAVEKDDALSTIWYRKAAEGGDVEAQSLLGYNYLVGCGVKKNFFLAYMWCYLASIQGDKTATKNLIFGEKGLSPEQISQAQDLARTQLSQKN